MKRLRSLAAAPVVAALAISSLAVARPRPDPIVANNTVDPVVKGAWRSSAAAPGAPYPGRFGPLSADERAIGETAWRYIVNNTQSSTGFVNAADNYPSATLWDIGSALAGITAAQGIGIITHTAAIERLQPMLGTLRNLRLFRGLCPNKAYDTRTAAPVDYTNQPAEIGCSALDVGRLLAWLAIVADRFPELAGAVDAVVSHLNIGTLVAGGVLQGAALDAGGKIEMLQEGRLGYEEYAAKAFSLWGFDTATAAKPEPYGLATLYGVRIAYDSRDPKLLGAHNYVVAESAILDGLEFGWNDPEDATSPPLAHRKGWFASVADSLYRVQAARYARTGILTARTEHQLVGPPYFVYDTIFTDGQPWATITDTGVAVPAAAALSTKAAVGMWALWQTPYTDQLFAAARGLTDPARGMKEGRLEQTGAAIETFTVNSNAIILESLLYKMAGPLHRPGPQRIRPATLPTVTVVTPAAIAAAAPMLAASLPTASRRGDLTADELAAAKVAWRYFVNNTQASTGLVNAADNYASTTLWDTAAALGAIVSARELGVISPSDAEARLARIVDVFGSIKLFRGLCPNKAYNTVTVVPTDYGNQPAEIGCSAIDIGRMLVLMRVVHNRYPMLRRTVQAAVDHWNIGALVRDGEMSGTVLVKNRIEYRQEGRLGYEEYAAKGFQLWGQRTPLASRAEPYEKTTIEGVPIAHDKRDWHNSGGHNYVVTESYALDGIEFGWVDVGAAKPDPWTVAQAHNVYLAQQRRHEHTGILTARTEHQLVKPPYFVYDSVFSDGHAWATIDISGNPVPGAEAVAAKAAIGMWALWPTSYTDLLFAQMLPARDAERGFFEGTFEAGGPIRAYTANNNGIILETLLFKAKGPLVQLPPL